MREPKRNHIHYLTTGLRWWTSPSVLNLKRKNDLKELGRECYFQLSNFLKSIGFKIYPQEPWLLVQEEVRRLIYVDEILVISKAQQSLNESKISYVSQIQWFACSGFTWHLRLRGIFFEKDIVVESFCSIFDPNLISASISETKLVPDWNRDHLFFL